MTLVLVAVAALTLLLITGACSSLLGSGAGRTIARTAALEVLDETGEVAVAEAVAHVRMSMDAPPGAKVPGDWRRLVLAALQPGATPPPAQRVEPARLRTVLATRLPEVVVGDVSARLLALFPGNQTRSPQGVLELSVEVRESGGAAGNLRRTVTQRRLFYLTTGKRGPEITLLAAPIATVAE